MQFRLKEPVEFRAGISIAFNQGGEYEIWKDALSCLELEIIGTEHSEGARVSSPKHMKVRAQTPNRLRILKPNLGRDLHRLNGVFDTSRMCWCDVHCCRRDG